MISIRRLGPDEGPLLRALRLAALTSDPGAFGATLAETEARPMGHWDETAAGLDGARAVVLVADSGDRPVGLVRGTRSSSEADNAELTSMWVDPIARGAGVGLRLVGAALDWAGSLGCDSVGLWVVRGNEAAVALYRRAGFVDDGGYRPRPDDPCASEVRMIRRLDQA